MKRLFPAAVAALLLSSATAALADPPAVGGDDGYARLARWESRLDDRIGEGVRNGSVDPRQAWKLQKDLDNVELRALQAHYENGNIDPGTFHSLGDQLRRISYQLGMHDSDFGQWGYGPPPPPGPGPGYGPPPGPPPGYYQQGRYESDCHRGNAAAGTIFGAIAGGLIGGAASHGNGGAIAGGVILGGLFGNAIASDVSCDDRGAAFNTFSVALNGDIGRRYDWHHGDHNGYIVVKREYRDGGYVCRDFHTVSFRDGQRFDRDGSACRQDDDNWHFR
jgi:surface antigen